MASSDLEGVDLYFDYASPWAYLVDEILTRRLSRVTIVRRPIYLRGLETFAKGLPYTGNKLAYLTRDLVRVAEHERVPVNPPATFPVDGLRALRGAYIARAQGAEAFERYHRAAFRAAWSEQKDISRKEMVADLLVTSAGLTLDAALAALAEPAVKAKLREATAEAEARGVFGVPTFFVRDEMFWGYDRLDFVARAVGQRGESPATG